MRYQLKELVKGLDVTIKGDAECEIIGVSPIQDANAGHISFLTNTLYRKHLANTKAAAVILSPEDAEHCPVNAVISKNPYFTYAKIAEYFNKAPQPVSGVHPAAVIGEGCEIDSSAAVSAQAVLGNRVKVGAKAVIGRGCVLGDDVIIGDETQLDANVSLYHKVQVGKRCHICSGVVIGADGFGFANEKGSWYKVPQLGTVLIGDDVDIGANTTIDRGAVEDTIIRDGVKLDNLIQIGHNVVIGEHTVIAGCTGVAGSTNIGKHCMIGGASMILGHITLCDKVMITGGTGVSRSITEPGIYSSGVVGVVTNKEFRKNNARFHRLESLMQRVKTLESTVKALTESEE